MPLKKLTTTATTKILDENKKKIKIKTKLIQHHHQEELKKLQSNLIKEQKNAQLT